MVAGSTGHRHDICTFRARSGRFRERFSCAFMCSGRRDTDSLAACCAWALSAHFSPGWRPAHVLRAPVERYKLAIREGNE
eukprot:scaffold19412_cov42-Phaeocystis_antarctica.AAC.1